MERWLIVLDHLLSLNCVGKNRLLIEILFVELETREKLSEL